MFKKPPVRPLGWNAILEHLLRIKETSSMKAFRGQGARDLLAVGQNRRAYIVTFS
jgi:hypothetical protein